jgi:hypothetical protein
MSVGTVIKKPLVFLTILWGLNGIVYSSIGIYSGSSLKEIAFSTLGITIITLFGLHLIFCAISIIFCKH